MNVHSHMGIEPGLKVLDAFFSSCWRVPIIRNSVVASLIIKRLAINQERTSAMYISIADSVNFGMDRARSEGDVKLVVVSITMDGRETLRNNVEEAGDVESE